MDFELLSEEINKPTGKWGIREVGAWLDFIGLSNLS